MDYNPIGPFLGSPNWDLERPHRRIGPIDSDDSVCLD